MNIYAGSNLLAALEGLFAGDMGADSGIRDEVLRMQCRSIVAQWLPDDERARLGSRLFGTSEARVQGYTDEDVEEFDVWIANGLAL